MSVGSNYPADMDETLGSRIRAARKAANLTQQQVADHFGIKRVNVTQWESDTTRPDGYRLPDLARLLQVDEAEFRQVIPETQRATIIPGRELVAQNGDTLPIFAGAKGGDGHIMVSFDEVERVKMPSVLQGVKGGYGLLIDGESMVPAFYPGDTALVHPHLRPARGFNHVFYHSPPHTSEAEAIIKELVNFTDRDWTLKQWNQAKEWKESRQVWRTCHRVVGKYDRR
jgi:transcriptional regulator with XRE-family HTH domain